MENKTVPEGYMENSRGDLVRIENIQEIDLARHDLVLEIVGKAKPIAGVLADFKAATLGDIDAFVVLSGEKYGAQLGGKKGNISLTSFDGKYMVKRSIDDSIGFDERLQAAKALVDDCLRGWTEGSRPEVQTLINAAFQVDKEGNISATKVLGLRKLKIHDEKWQQAMKAIADSVQVMSSKQYLRIYERNEDGGYVQLNLNIAT